MINQKDNPVEWAGLLYELGDAVEHIESLTEEMLRDGAIDEIDYAIQLEHIFSHLNRAWNSRSHIGKIDKKLFDEYSGQANPRSWWVAQLDSE